MLGHGVGASVDETRPLASGIAGTRVFLHFRGHGGSRALDDQWGYAALAGDLRAVADHVGATRALGVSMGAAALIRLLADTPDRFERLVFFLPAALDRVRTDIRPDRVPALAAAVDDGDVDRLALLLREDLPAEVLAMRGVDALVTARARMLAGTAVSRVLCDIAGTVPVADREMLAAVSAPALVVGQEGDPVHRDDVARDLAGALREARLEIFPATAGVWVDRARLRAVVGGFLSVVS